MTDGKARKVKTSLLLVSEAKTYFGSLSQRSNYFLAQCSPIQYIGQHHPLPEVSITYSYVRVHPGYLVITSVPRTSPHLTKIFNNVIVSGIMNYYYAGHKSPSSLR